ncbi:MAG: 1-deoxy-D-xylulose-5-phosphate synthase [Deltaproteobacteria bacterium]|nr:MAG: 1-deoxy-D-xylulose-5-phosphate synthase [Deltaproteobacteria bacterium]
MGDLLDRIDSPQDLKKLSVDDLSRLAQEIREEIINTVSRTGGHLASSLGVVELTIALHYVFNAPGDKLIWDVGHQSYAHKLLTGRRREFKTLRQFGGISGFLKREESPYDTYGSGHSSTSISASLGIAEALRFKGENNKVIAVIGDGSLTAGISFEGLNQVGDRQRDLIVVLNDNAVSIAPSVGALSSFLSRKLTGRFITGLRRELKSFLQSIPSIGEDVYKVLRRAEDSLKSFITPGILFEGLGFYYVGPIRGHRIDILLETLENIKKWERPILLHVLTTKGKGYLPAERDPANFHGVGPFKIATGKPISQKGQPRSYTEIFGQTMVSLAKKDKRIVGITAAMPEGTGLDRFGKEFPDRFYDVGIAEQHGITFAAGMAAEGFKPVSAIYSTFLQRAYDQILHDVCLQNLPVVFALDRGGIVGEDGPTHHGLFDLSYLRHMPNMIVMAPKDENELQHMLKTALEYGRPASLRYPRGKGCGVSLDTEIKSLPLGKAEVLQEGADLAIVGIGSTVYPAWEAARRLSQSGIQATVVNSRFVKPLDTELFCSLAKKVKNIITVEENVLQGGFGSAVLELLAENGVSGVKVKRLGIDDRFVEHGPVDRLRKECGIDTEGIEKAVQEMLGDKGK